MRMQVLNKTTMKVMSGNLLTEPCKNANFSSLKNFSCIRYMLIFILQTNLYGSYFVPIVTIVCKLLAILRIYVIALQYKYFVRLIPPFWFVYCEFRNGYSKSSRHTYTKVSHCEASLH